MAKPRVAIFDFACCEGCQLTVVDSLQTHLELVEMVEITDHPWFIACQFHPEFTSTPRDGHPLFSGFIRAARAHREAAQPEPARSVAHADG